MNGDSFTPNEALRIAQLEAERDALRDDLAEVRQLRDALHAQLVLARAVLESASVSGPTEPHWRRLWVKEDVWQAWRERKEA